MAEDNLVTIGSRLQQIQETLRIQDERLERLEKMASALSTELSAIQTSLTSIQTGIANLDAQIQALQNSPGTLGPADQAALDAIASSSAALATAANAVPPVASTPAVAAALKTP